MLRGDQLLAIRGDRPVLRGVSFSLARGQGMLVCGGNGSGKSTLLRILSGLRRPDGGRLHWGQDDILADPASHMARLAYLGHQDAIKPALTVQENLTLSGPATPAVLHETLAESGLDHMHALPARFLSAGQRRRLALVRLLLAQRLIWLLDEPSVGLDAQAVAWLETLIGRHLAAGGLVVAATHTPLAIPALEVLSL